MKQSKDTIKIVQDYVKLLYYTTIPHQPSGNISM